MPTGRCAHCGFLCNPDLIGCPDPVRPCPKGRVYYCGFVCQSSDAEKHKLRYHLPKNKAERPVCEHFVKGYCAFGHRCVLYHPKKPANGSPRPRCDSSKNSDSGCGSPPSLESSPPCVVGVGTHHQNNHHHTANDNGVALIVEPMELRNRLGYEEKSSMMGMFPINNFAAFPSHAQEEPQQQAHNRQSTSPDKDCEEEPGEDTNDNDPLQMNQLLGALTCEEVEQRDRNNVTIQQQEKQKLPEKEERADETLNSIDERLSTLPTDDNSSLLAVGKEVESLPKNDEEGTSDTAYGEEFPSLAEAASFNHSKKSRLESKREARKSKKMVRKKEKMARVAAFSESEDPSSNSATLINVEEKGVPVPSSSDPPQIPDVPQQQTVPNNTKLSHNSNKEEIPLDRKLTKKEKKREERKLLNVLKKREKQKKKESEMNEEANAKKKFLTEMFEQKMHLKCAVECTKIFNQQQKGGNKKENTFLMSMRRDCHFEMGKIKNALRDAELAVEISGGEDSDCLLMLLRLQMATGAIEEANKTACILGPECPVAELKRLKEIETNLEAITSALEDQDWSLAVEKAIHVEGFCTDFDHLKLLKTEARLHLHILEEAESVLVKLNYEFSKDPYYCYLSTLKSSYTDRWWAKEDSFILKSFENCKEVYPRFARTYEIAQQMRSTYYNAQLWIKNDKLAEAQQLLETGLNIDCNNPAYLADIYCLLASLADNDEDKLKDLCKSIKLKETSEAYMERGNVYRSERKYEEAVQDFENAARLNPSCPDISRTLDQTRRNLSSSLRHGASAAAHRMENKDFYAILGVSQNASTDEIKRAFLSKAQEFHPDKHCAASQEIRAEMEIRMKAVNKAYKVLKDDRQREIYDRKQKRKSATTADVDLDVSEEDYECYNSSDEEMANLFNSGTNSHEMFTQLFFKIFRMNGLKKSPSPGPSGTSSTGQSSRGKRRTK